MEKLFIKNRKGQKLSVLLEISKESKGIVFVMHGLGGNKEQAPIIAMAEAFKKAHYTVIRFDTTNTLGESDGSYEEATITNYYEDLYDVIVWGRSQNWYTEPFVLAGHSLGGIASALYAQQNPKNVKALLLLSTVISGELSAKSPRYKDVLKDWEKTGWMIRSSDNKLPWSHMTDRYKYNLLDSVNKLTMPVCMIVGDADTTTPSSHQQILFKLLPGKRIIHVIKNAPHTFSNYKHLEQLKDLSFNWIKSNII